METRFLDVSGGRIAYDDTGAGPLVICVPGMGDLRAEYRFLAPQLISAGYRVVTMDPRGEGESSVRWADYSVASVGVDLLALARSLGAGPAVVIGNSMAAGAAVCAAAEAPEQFAGLVLVGPAVRDGQPLWQARILSLLLYGPMLSGPWGVSMWIRYFTTLFPSAKPDDFDAYCQQLRATMHEPGRMAALRAMLATPKRASEERLARVTTPALIVMGSKDPDFPDATAEAKLIASRLGGTDSRVEMLAGLGHYPHAEAPDRFTPLSLDFLRRVAPTQAGATHGAE